MACGRMGYEALGCFTIIGYPEWWEDIPRNRAPNRNTQKPTQPKGNTTTVAKTETSKVQANVTITDADRLGLTGITDEQ